MSNILRSKKSIEDIKAWSFNSIRRKRGLLRVKNERRPVIFTEPPPSTPILNCLLIYPKKKVEAPSSNSPDLNIIQVELSMFFLLVLNYCITKVITAIKFVCVKDCLGNLK